MSLSPEQAAKLRELFNSVQSKTLEFRLLSHSFAELTEAEQQLDNYITSLTGESK